MTLPQYLKAVPARADLPAGLVVVHNSVRPTRRLGSRGFRAWLAPPEDGLVGCDCGWAPELGTHYSSSSWSCGDSGCDT